MEDIHIIDFYEKNIINPFFDENNYAENYPETELFYQPYCIENNYTEKQRLYFHYIVYGRDQGFQPFYVHDKVVLLYLLFEMQQQRLKYQDILSLIENNLRQPLICKSKRQKANNIRAIKYLIENLL